MTDHSPYKWLSDFRPARPVCIDLDGTFVRHHALWCPCGHFKVDLMSLPRSIVQSITSFLGKGQCPVWHDVEHIAPLSFLCTHSRSLSSAFQWHVSKCQSIDPSAMVYRSALIECMIRWKSMGVPLYLVTGSPMPLAQAVFMHSGLFDGFLSSTTTVYLVGRIKAKALVHRWGVEGFHYIGDSWKDRHVWSVSKDILTVVPPKTSLFLKIIKTKRPEQSVYTLE